ncbi:MAG: hypothetical protein KBT21_05475 [Treponema sp.]|nr:hypothetical protein [Candidatus Treponema merdequi]
MDRDGEVAQGDRSRGKMSAGGQAPRENECRGTVPVTFDFLQNEIFLKFKFQNISFLFQNYFKFKIYKKNLRISVICGDFSNFKIILKLNLE